MSVGNAETRQVQDDSTMQVCMHASMVFVLNLTNHQYRVSLSESSHAPCWLFQYCFIDTCSMNNSVNQVAAVSARAPLRVLTNGPELNRDHSITRSMSQSFPPLEQLHRVHAEVVMTNVLPVSVFVSNFHRMPTDLHVYTQSAGKRTAGVVIGPGGRIEVRYSQPVSALVGCM